MSHRLKPEAPAGYNPAAYRFDDEVVEAIHDNSPKRIIEIDHDLRTNCRRVWLPLNACRPGRHQELQPACEVLNYEAPFGVGYLVAQLTRLTQP